MLGERSQCLNDYILKVRLFFCLFTRHFRCYAVFNNLLPKMRKGASGLDRR